MLVEVNKDSSPGQDLWPMSKGFAEFAGEAELDVDGFSGLPHGTDGHDLICSLAGWLELEEASERVGRRPAIGVQF